MEQADYALRRENITAQHVVASMEGLFDVLEASCEGSEQQVDDALRRASCDHPDGRYLIAYTVAMCVAKNLDLEQMRDELRSAGIHALPVVEEPTAIHALPVEPPTGRVIFGQDGWSDRRTAAIGYLLAYLSSEEDASMFLTDKYGHHVLQGLAELHAATCPNAHPHTERVDAR